MTTEQRETIEVCKKKIIEPFYDFPNPTSIELMETVLSVLKEKDEEIEQKDKIGDLMAEFIGKYHCFAVNVFKVDNECKNENNCKECIKQYFAELASRSAGRATDS